MYVLREVPGAISAPTENQISSLKRNYPHNITINAAPTSQMHNMYVNPLQTIFREIWPYHQNLKPVYFIIHKVVSKFVNSLADFTVRYYELSLLSTKNEKNFFRVILSVCG
jgi:hypothetical protein